MATAIKEMSDKELDSYLEEARRELLTLRSNYAVTRSLQKPSRVRQLKRNVARVLTVQRERELLSVKNKEGSATDEKTSPSQANQPNKKAAKSKNSRTGKAKE